jgi:hypothetical protein
MNLLLGAKALLRTNPSYDSFEPFPDHFLDPTLIHGTEDVYVKCSFPD